VTQFTRAFAHGQCARHRTFLHPQQVWKAALLIGLVASSFRTVNGLDLDCVAVTEVGSDGAITCQTDFTSPPFFHSCVEEWVCFEDTPFFCDTDIDFGVLQPDGSLKVKIRADSQPPFFGLDIMVRDKGLGKDTLAVYQFFAHLTVLVELFPNQSFEFDLKTKLHGTTSPDYNGRGAYDNAKLNLKVRIDMGDTLPDIVEAIVDGFDVECQQTPFRNILEKEGPGVGDQFNKYAWSMLNFKDGTTPMHWSEVGRVAPRWACVP